MSSLKFSFAWEISLASGLLGLYLPALLCFNCPEKKGLLWEIQGTNLLCTFYLNYPDKVFSLIPIHFKAISTITLDIHSGNQLTLLLFLWNLQWFYPPIYTTWYNIMSSTSLEQSPWNFTPWICCSAPQHPYWCLCAKPSAFKILRNISKV